MKLQKTIRTGLIASSVTMAALLAFGTAHAGKNDNNKQGPGISITNHCTLENNTTLRIVTNITDISSGVDTPIYFVSNGMIVHGEQKGTGNWKNATEFNRVTKTARLGEIVTDLSLCHTDPVTGANLGTVLDPATKALNTTITIDVENDNKSAYSNRCMDNLLTEAVNEAQVPVSPDVVDAYCRLQ